MAKRSQDKATQGGRKHAFRVYKPSGTAVEEVVIASVEGRPVRPPDSSRRLQRPLIRGGEVVADAPDLEASRQLLRDALVTLPWDGLKLSHGEPAIPTKLLP